MRWLRHFFAPSAQSRFPPALMSRIGAAIAQGEQLHTGQVMFAVEADLPCAELWRKTDARARAEHVFAVLRTWDTHANNGVLVYLLLADHAIEIVADRGLDGHVHPEQWQAVCERLRSGLKAGDDEPALLAALGEVAVLLAGAYPAHEGTQRMNELPDAPRILK